MEDLWKLLIIIFFTINKYKTFDDLSREERINSLKDKYLEYVNKNAFLKALKRLKSLIKLDEKKHKELELLNNFFDGKLDFFMKFGVKYQLYYS